MQRLAEDLLRIAAPAGVRGNLLEVHHPDAPGLNPGLLHGACDRLGLRVSLRGDDGGTQAGRLSCSSSQLPFQDATFCTVVLHQIVGDGREPELEEAIRVLAPGGALFVLGLNRAGWRYRHQQGALRLPGFAPLRVRARLEHFDMSVRCFAAAGLLGRPGPRFSCRGLAAPGVLLADMVLLEAHHHDSPQAKRIGLDTRRPAIVQSAPIRG